MFNHVEADDALRQWKWRDDTFRKMLFWSVVNEDGPFARDQGAAALIWECVDVRNQSFKSLTYYLL